MKCKECIHERVCEALIKKGLPYADEKYLAEAFCMAFRNKADFVEVVRCKDCKYWRNKHGGFCEASNALSEVNNENKDFCSYGKRSDTE